MTYSVWSAPRHALEQRLAEAHREPQHLEAEPARHPEMAELVHGHQQADGDDEPQELPADIHRSALQRARHAAG